MLRDYTHLQRWERSILKLEDHSDGFIVRGIRAIPWSGVAMFAVVMVFFGVDLGAGVKETTKQIKEKRNTVQVNAQVQKVKAREWSVEQVKNYREGELPQPSWTAGGPRDASKKTSLK